MIYQDRVKSPDFFEQWKLKLNQQKHIISYFEKPECEKIRNRINIKRFHPRDKLEVLLALTKSFYNKCAFCEISLGDCDEQIRERANILFYRPRQNARLEIGSPTESRNHYLWLAWEWANMFPSCNRCLFAKGYQFPIKKNRADPLCEDDELEKESPLLLNPCKDRPEKHLCFTKDGTVSSHTLRGKVTIEVFDLNHTDLIKARKQEAMAFTELWHRGEIVDTLQVQCERDQPFSALKQELLREWQNTNKPREDVRNSPSPNISNHLESEQHKLAKNGTVGKALKDNQDNSLPIDSHNPIQKLETTDGKNQPTEIPKDEHEIVIKNKKENKFYVFSLNKESHIGKGATADVYRGKLKDSNEELAIKILNNIGGRRVEVECQKYAILSHDLNAPYVVPFYCYGKLDKGILKNMEYYLEYYGRNYLIMKYMDGGTLDNQLKKESEMSYAKVLFWLDGIATTIDYLYHKLEMAHRDIKPQNILFDKAGKGYLSDFGIVKIINDPELTAQDQHTPHTPAFASPEQISGTAKDFQFLNCDQYSLAKTVWYAFALNKFHVDIKTTTDFIPETIEQIEGLQKAQQVKKVCGVLRKALDSDPENRYRSCRVFFQELTKART